MRPLPPFYGQSVLVRDSHAVAPRDALNLIALCPAMGCFVRRQEVPVDLFGLIQEAVEEHVGQLYTRR